MARNIVQARAWQARYGRAQVLFDVSLDVGEGEVVTLLGRNGMGRSTTVKCLFGMLPITAGSFEVDGAPVVGLPSHRIARLGLSLVPEGRQVFTQLTVEENLRASARARRSDARGSWDLDRVYQLFPRLQERRTNLGWQLSGGEQQMLAIGRALMTNPRLLVLDEAMEGFAPIVSDEIWKTPAVLKEEGLVQLVIDKHLAPLLKLGDRHYIIERGRIVWEGDSRSLSENGRIKETCLGV